MDEVLMTSSMVSHLLLVHDGGALPTVGTVGWHSREYLGQELDFTILVTTQGMVGAKGRFMNGTLAVA